MKNLTSLDCQNLLSHNRQDFEINAIKFVKTRPGAARCQTLYG